MEEAVNRMDQALTRSTQATRLDWDAIVIGAGPAGALAARQIALQGLHTLLIDGKHFPRAKVCGGYLNSRALQALREVGLGHVANRSPEFEVDSRARKTARCRPSLRDGARGG